MSKDEIILEELKKVQELLIKNRFSEVTEKSCELWAIKDIAEFCKFSVRHIQELINTPLFPNAVVIPSQKDPNKPSRHPRWISGEVVRYFKRFKLDN